MPRLLLLGYCFGQSEDVLTIQSANQKLEQKLKAATKPKNVKENAMNCSVGFPITGFVQIFGSKIQDFFQTFSKTVISFFRLKVIK